ncbi:LLM class flavin-dependent oxidoreductase [Mycobacterium sp. 1245852.3]|uniref:LLM class flavin-dependent oxidoreductase n=1 Tax=Mycobacterium sp. 1245852.3 TaxID=1856860 RepID=UPI0007FC56EB|nr:LLM class flavin-dependent oxidoreductase [Mycobacterium sp. 1245852.3]OBJ90432.1 hypothetical protein A9W96_22970 [Mycobacterium sp. 1245852.3]
MIKPWLFEFVHCEHDPARREDPSAVQQKYRDYIDLWVAGEQLGWEGIFFSEHHFGPGYSPSPNLMIAHLAARTSTLRLGVLGTVSAYATPWRVAEEFAMLDHLTAGRLEMGVVSGIPPELAVVGIDGALAAAVHAETLEVLLAAIDKPLVSHHGEHFHFDNVRITPSFLQSDPQIWTASTSPESARRAGERGLKMCTAFKEAEALAPVVAAYQEGAKSAGKPAGADRVGIRRVVSLVADESDSDKAADNAKEGTLELFRVIAEATQKALPDAAATGQLGKDELISGTPAQVADEIIRQCTVAGVGNFLTVFNIFDPDDLRTNHELFGREVIPRLRAAQID